jgi:hypothetical protein
MRGGTSECATSVIGTPYHYNESENHEPFSTADERRYLKTNREWTRIDANIVEVGVASYWWGEAPEKPDD